jgi:hypothetical protein
MDNLAAPPPPVTTAPEGAGEPGATPSPDAPKPDAGS